VWLGELYRLVTTYNILGKAGYTLDSPVTSRALINTLNDNMLSEDDDSPFLHHRNPSTLPPAKREGMKFARRVLLTTWDSVLEILSAPLETSISGEQPWTEVGRRERELLGLFGGRIPLGSLNPDPLITLSYFIYQIIPTCCWCIGSDRPRFTQSNGIF